MRCFSQLRCKHPFPQIPQTTFTKGETDEEESSDEDDKKDSTEEKTPVEGKACKK